VLLKQPLQKDPEVSFSCISKPASNSIWRYSLSSSFPFFYTRKRVSPDLCLSYTVGWSVPRQIFTQFVPCSSRVSGLTLDLSHHLGLIWEALSYHPNLVPATAATPLSPLVYCRSAPRDGTAPLPPAAPSSPGFAAPWQKDLSLALTCTLSLLSQQNWLSLVQWMGSRHWVRRKIMLYWL